MLADGAGDGLLKVGNGMEHAASQALPGQGGKEALDNVNPERRGRGEVEPQRGWRSSQARTLGCLRVA